MDLDRDALLAAFAAEVEEVLPELERGLIALEEAPDDAESLKAAFRAAHTLKGAAACIALDDIVAIAHAIEAVLERRRAGDLALRPAHIGALLEAIDAMRALAARVLREGDEGAEGGGEAERGAAREVVATLARLAASPPRGERDAVAPACEDAALPGGEHLAALRTARAPSLRVDADKLERMLDLAGEIAIARGRMGEMLSRARADDDGELAEAHRELGALHLALQELIMQARLVHIGPVFRQHVRTLRDLSQKHGKQARLVVEGGEVELDMMLVEQLRAPLLHLVRNAFDHGLEPAAVREASGKDPCGTVTLRARHDGSRVVVQVEDDGAGLDLARIRARALERGLLSEGATLGEDELSRLIFEPGFSTAASVTEVSGRGVGLDVVRRSVDALHGAVHVSSRPGRGATFTMRLPLTLAIIEGFSVGAAGETYVLPLDTVIECTELNRAATGIEDDGRGVMSLRGEPLPYVRLRRLFELEGPAPSRENIVVVQHEGRRAGIAVDELFGEQQTVVKPLGRLFQGVPGVSGSAILGTGRVGLILDVAGLMHHVLSAAQDPS